MVNTPIVIDTSNSANDEYRVGINSQLECTKNYAANPYTDSYGRIVMNQLEKYVSAPHLYIGIYINSTQSLDWDYPHTNAQGYSRVHIKAKYINISAASVDYSANGGDHNFHTNTGRYIKHNGSVISTGSVATFGLLTFIEIVHEGMFSGF